MFPSNNLGDFIRPNYRYGNPVWAARNSTQKVVPNIKAGCASMKHQLDIGGVRKDL